MTTSNASSDIYSGISELGNLQSSIGLILGIIVGIAFVIIGAYYVVFNDDNKYYHVAGTVALVKCSATVINENNKNIPIYKCEMTLNYALNDKTYGAQIVINSRKRYFTGESVQIAVSKTNARDIKIDEISSFTMGMISSFCAILLIGICYLNFYLTHHYKPYAALQGARSVWGVFK